MISSETVLRALAIFLALSSIFIGIASWTYTYPDISLGSSLPFLMFMFFGVAAAVVLWFREIPVERHTGRKFGAALGTIFLSFLLFSVCARLVDTNVREERLNSLLSSQGSLSPADKAAGMSAILGERYELLLTSILIAAVFSFLYLYWKGDQRARFPLTAFAAVLFLLSLGFGESIFLIAPASMLLQFSLLFGFMFLASVWYEEADDAVHTFGVNINDFILSLCAFFILFLLAGMAFRAGSFDIILPLISFPAALAIYFLRNRPGPKESFNASVFLWLLGFAGLVAILQINAGLPLLALEFLKQGAIALVSGLAAHSLVMSFGNKEKRRARR